jgi:hypothetical protein
VGGNALRTGCMQRPSCSPSSMLVRKDPETAPLCPQCGDAMRLARKLPPVRPLAGLVVHLCGRCGHVGTAEREPDEADLSSVRGAHEARQAIALARPQTPRGPPVSVHRLRACRHGRVARAGGPIVEAGTPALAQGARQRGFTDLDRLTPQARGSFRLWRSSCSQHTASPSIRQGRTLRWFTASTTSGKRIVQSFAAAGDQPDADGVPASHEPVAVVLDLVNPV